MGSKKVSDDIGPPTTRFERPITAAFDFGTSTSGYAFAFTDDKNVIFTNCWQMDKDVLTTTAKAPTSVLLMPDKYFDSFGYDAEERYAELCNEEEQNGWYFFQRFKTLLYKTKRLTRDTEIHDVEGKPMPAIDVFAIVIRELKARLMVDIQTQKGEVSDGDILYVITVPAIWSDAAKQFMREAAVKAGINTGQLRLALEPEAASVYCRQYPSRRTERDGKVCYQPFPVGHRYIVADLGGGTVDIATHEVVPGNRLHEIHNATGENIGSLRFDEEFLAFLENVFGRDLMTSWAKKEPGDFMKLQRSIEGVKWSLSATKKKKGSPEASVLNIKSGSLDYIFLNIPYTLHCYFLESGKNLDNALKEAGFQDEVKAVRGKARLKLSVEFVRKFFKKSLDGIVSELQSILSSTKGSDQLDTIVIVGGLGKSEYVRDSILTAFPGKRVIVPSDTGLAVLRGAVLLGNCPEIIAGRIARYTYGINVVEPFKVGKHREDYIFYRDGEVLCGNVLKTLIQKGQVMKYGQVFETMGAITPKEGERKRKIYKTFLYQSTEKNPIYHTDESCTKIGGFLLDPPDEGWPDYCDCKIQIIVGEAEFKFMVEILGKTYDDTLDFLMQQ